MQQSAPAAAEVYATEAPAATEAPMMEMAPVPAPTMAADAAREVPTETPMEKSAGAPSANSAPQDQPQVEHVALIPVGWQISFLAVVVLGAAVMFALRQSAKRKWL